VYYVSGSTPEQRALAAKFNITILHMFPSMGKARMQANINAIRALNPSIKLGQYTILNEVRASASPGDEDYAAVQAVNQNKWFARGAKGELVNWTNLFNNYAVNTTGWATADANGRRWPQWKAKFDSDTLFSGLTGLNYVFLDNMFDKPRVDADWQLVGSVQPRTNTTVQAAYRAGTAAYWSSLRSMNPSLMMMGNTDNDLASAEYKAKFQGAFLECQMGKSWSFETWAGWNVMMQRYRAVLANTAAPRDVVFQVCSPVANDFALMRYGLASTLLENGYFAYTVNNVIAPPRFDEFDAPIGTPVEAPPTAAHASGLWVRRYSNGMVLVNPGNSTLSMDVGAGYRHIRGTQDPVVNNGLTARMVSLPPRSGLLLLKQ